MNNNNEVKLDFFFKFVIFTNINFVDHITKKKKKIDCSEILSLGFFFIVLFDFWIIIFVVIFVSWWSLNARSFICLRSLAICIFDSYFRVYTQCIFEFSFFSWLWSIRYGWLSFSFSSVQFIHSCEGYIEIMDGKITSLTFYTIWQ